MSTSATMTQPRRTVVGRARAAVRRPAVASKIPIFVFALTVVALLVAAVFDLEFRSQGWDAHTLRAWADRADRLDSGLYTDTANQRGVLWVLLYLVPFHIAPRAAYWFVIAGFVVVVAALTGAAVGVAARWRTGSRAAAAAAGVGLAVYLALGREEFSRVLYSRNLASLFTAASFALLWQAVSSTDRRRATAALVAGGACAGVAVQTLPTAAIPLAVVGVTLWVVLSRHHGGPLARRVLVRTALWGGACIAVIASVPLYYAARGQFRDFWDLYWEYNILYSDATGRSFVEQLLKGAHDFAFYYADHPVYGIVIGAFAVSTVSRWRREDRLRRTFDVALLAWWAAEMLAVTMAQRFFPHYLLLPLVPVAVMAGVLAARLQRVVPRYVLPFAPVLGAVAVAYFGGAERVVEGWRVASRFDGLDDHVDRAFLSDDDLALAPFQAAAGRRRGQQALVDATTSPAEYLWAWSDWSSYYTYLDRPPASRYLSRHWLVGYVHGGGSSPNNILPGTFENLAEDLRKTPPAMFLAPVDVVPPTDRIVGGYVSRNFTSVFIGAGANFLLRNDRYEQLQGLFERDAGTPATLSPGRAPTSRGAIAVSATEQARDPVRGDAVHVELPSRCAVVSARTVRGAAAASELVVSLVEPDDPSRAAEVAMLPDTAVSRRSWAKPADLDSEFPLPPSAADGTEELRIVISGRSALVALDGRIVGMTRATDDDPLLVLSAGGGRVVVTDVETRPLTAREWPACASAG